MYTYDRIVAGARRELTPAVELMTRDRALTCPQLNLETVAEFADMWLWREAIRRSASGA